MRRAAPPLVVVLTVALFAVSIWSAGRFPAEDAPGLLATTSALVQEPWHLLDLVIPHPPMGYVLAAWPWVLGLGTQAPVLAGGTALALCWWGMRQLAGEPPWGAWLLLVATPMTWTAVEHLHWDLLLAGVATAALGALHRDRVWLAGLLMAAAALTKVTAPLFLALPALYWLFQKRDPRLLIALVALPWALWHHAELALYLGSSVSADVAMDSASPAPSGLALLAPKNLAYYPAVLRTALGWPGLVVLAVGCALGRQRLPLLAGLGGLILLSLLGRREARYLLPALPALLVAAEVGLGRFRLVMALGLVQLGFSAWTFGTYEEPRNLRKLTFVLDGWDWPGVPESFAPISSPIAEWRIDQALDALPTDEPVGLLLFDHIVVPIPEHLQLRSEQRGLHHRFVAMRFPRGPGGPEARALPWGSTDVEVIYAVHPKNERRTREWLEEQGFELEWDDELPYGYVGRRLRRAQELP